MNEEIEMLDEIVECADIVLSCGFVMILDKNDGNEDWVLIRKEEELEFVKPDWFPKAAEVPY